MDQAAEQRATGKPASGGQGPTDGERAHEAAPRHAPHGYALDEQIGYLLRLASQRHATIFQANSLQGLTPTQFSALVRLAEHGAVSQNQLGRMAAMDVATIKGVVDRLRERGLATATRDETDKRRMVIALSEAGRQLVAEMTQMGRTISRQTLEPLSKSEQETLIALLKRLG